MKKGQKKLKGNKKFIEIHETEKKAKPRTKLRKEKNQVKIKFKKILP